MVSSKYHKETYSANDVERLCLIGAFRPDDFEEFRANLENIAATYRWEAAKHANVTRSSDTSRNLKSLMKRIKKLELGLRNLSEEASHQLRLAIDRNNSTDFSLSITDALPEHAPSLSIPLPEDANPVMALDFGLPEVKHILSGLDRAVSDAIASLPKRTRGQTRNHALRLWMSNMELIWERNTIVPFTRDETSSGDQITPAARFCVAAFHCISPDYPVSRIMWEMRDRIHQSRKST